MYLMLNRGAGNHLCKHYCQDKNEQYMALEQAERICYAMNCTPNDILEFMPEEATQHDR